jgi:PAS domain S-box-containing protein
MRKALSGEAGTIIGLDYRGEYVLAAYEPLRVLDTGIVAKIDLAEIRLPFLRAGLISGIVAILAILLGACLFIRITRPVIQRLKKRTAEMEALNVQREREIGEHKQTEDLLREEKNKVQQYVDIAGTIILVIDSDQKVSLINRRGCEILGWDERDILGKNWFDHFIPEQNREKVKETFQGLMNDRALEMASFENPILTKDGDVA